MTFAARGPSAVHHVFVALVFATGAAALGHALLTLVAGPSVDWWWIALALLTIISGFFAVKVPTISATLSISEIFLFSLVMLYGTEPAVVTVAVDGLVVSLVRRHRDVRHAAFNMAEPALSMWVAASVYQWLSGVPPLTQAPATMMQVGWPALVLAGVYFVANSGLNAIAVATESNRRAAELMRKYFLWVSLNYFAGASIATIIAVNTGSNFLSGLLAIAPLIVVSYFTFKSAMGRLEDENVHLGEVNRLYLKVVETLAMAVDAKDQVTHGHVRRVQTFALSLARSMGVQDADQLKAIEAAALLHDIGKLAVPEHILNKPGRLSDAEYDRMKMHAPLGADMLTGVAFPYPVVPIVRHHHENWDGTGYPDGLAGEHIPVGARILSVVDCYDALRSHRPYRRALGPDEAMAIVRERRGTMYDPAVVDAFEKIQAAIEAEEVPDPLPEVMDRVAQVSRDMRKPEPDADAMPIEVRIQATDALLRLYEQIGKLSPDVPIDDICDHVTRYLRGLAPASLTVFYERDDSADQLRVLWASGFGEVLTSGLTIPMGQGVSGWAAAQRRSVINADAALDLGDHSARLNPRHRSVLSVPLLTRDRLFGSLTLYSIQPGAFSDEQRLALELLAAPLADLLSNHPARRPSSDVAGPGSAHDPHQRTLASLLRYESMFAGWKGRPLGVLCVSTHGSANLLAHAEVAVGQATRIADLVFRPDDGELVVVMPDCDIGAGELIANRVRAAMPAAEHTAPGVPGDTLGVGFACAPHDGDALSTLLSVARRRLAACDGTGSEAGRSESAVIVEGEPWVA